MSTWQDLARTEAQYHGCNEAIVLATVEAETSGTNETGDNGNAIGYGQVWYKWHSAAFQAEAERFGLEVPTDLSSATDLAMANDEYSMAVAVNVIQSIWEGCGGDWAQFTYSYVGPGISSSDFARRQAIWNKYNDSNYDYTGEASSSTTGSSSGEEPYYSQFPITSAYHASRSTGLHSGVDLGMDVGTKIISITSGTVTTAEELPYTGYTVMVKAGNGCTFVYGHLSQFNVSEGDIVSAGGILGLSGGAAGAPGAGNSTGPHLHLGVKDASGNYIDPTPYISTSISNYSLANNVTLPGTNMEVVAGSAAFGDVLYGRRYRVIVSSLDGETALDVSQLHCTFSCTKNYLIEPNYSEIVIYNMSPQTELTVIKEGYRVVIEAGYAGSQYGMIFDGNVVQVIREKENGTDYKVTLVALDSDMFFVSGTAAFSITRGLNARQIVEHITNALSVPTEIGKLSEYMPDNKLSRGKVVFGMGCDYFRQIAKSIGGSFYMEDGKINIVKAQDYTSEEAVQLTPLTGLIGVPAQQDYGASIKMLLNPRIKIGTFIHIDNSLIRNEKYDNGQAIYPLDQDGLYRAIKITHRGDTRGNDWYTEAETVTQLGILPSMAASTYQDPN